MKQNSVLLRDQQVKYIYKLAGFFFSFVNLLSKELNISGNDHFPKKESKGNLFSFVCSSSKKSKSVS